jgi:hypothetical protein
MCGLNEDASHVGLSVTQWSLSAVELLDCAWTSTSSASFSGALVARSGSAILHHKGLRLDRVLR